MDPAAGELHRRGRKLKLQDQPFKLLLLLIQRPGEVISREELKIALWPADTFVEFDQGVNTAIRKIRRVLGDLADRPRFIETLPRRGYRFIAPVMAVDAAVQEQLRDQGRSRIPMVWGAAGAIAVAAILLVSQGARPVESLIPVPLTSYPGLELQPSLSPDGNQVAFTWRGLSGENWDIYVKDIRADQPTRLTTDDMKDFGPAWSPDGRYIAFGRLLSPLKVGIFLIPAIGGLERKLTEATAPHERRPDPFLAWSPDSKWLAISEKPLTEFPVPNARLPEPDGTTPDRLFLLSVETSEKRQLTFPPAGSMFDSGPAFSPDGGTLAFVRALSPSVADLYLLDLSTDLHPSGKPRRLTDWNRPTSSPSWTPDGEAIIVSSGRWDASSLWRVAAFGPQSPSPLAFGEAHADSPTISRSGSLAYSQQLIDRSIWRIELSDNGETAVGRPFITSTQKDLFPQFSPDGRRILFLSSRTGNLEIWICDRDGANPKQLTSMNAPIVGAPRWSPDGERIVFDSNLGGQWDIYAVRATGGAPQHLTDDAVSDCCASWSHDGQWIYFMSARSGRYQIWKMPSGGGTAVQITQRGGHVALESPDGKFLYFSERGGEGERNGMGGLRRIPVDGGEEVLILPSVSFYNFAILSKGIYYIPKANPDGSSTFHFYDFASGDDRTLAAVDDSGPGISVSPDGRSLLYIQLDAWRSDLMLVRNFR